MSLLVRRFRVLSLQQSLRSLYSTQPVLVLGVHNLFQKDQSLTALSNAVNEEVSGRLVAGIEEMREKHGITADKTPASVVLRDIQFDSYSKIQLVNLLPYTAPTNYDSNSSLLSLSYSLEQGTWGALEHLRYKEWVRRQAALAVTYNKKHKISFDPMCDPQVVAEGATLATFKFNLKSVKPGDQLPAPSLYTKHLTDSESKKLWEKGVTIAEMQNNARRLSEMPSNLMSPQDFVAEAISQIKQIGNTTYDVRDPSWIQENLPGVHHVAKGSKTEPRFLTLSYKGDHSTEDTYVIVGKGVVFDTGGISLKPSASMELMRGDMAGAAVALSAFVACAKLGLGINLVCLTPLVENMPSSSAIKPGDLITHHNGKTVLVNNTDAEGRLILADTLSYASKFKPKLVINVATLTGASDVALGDSYSALFSNCHGLSHKLSLCGVATGELMWPMPIHYDYLAALRKSNADLDNISAGRSAGSGVGAAFLSEFVSYPWAHIDIGGSMMQKSVSTPYLKPNFMSGRPTRALIEFFSNPRLSSYDYVRTPKPYNLTTDKYQPISD